jgi:hypothetical protein
LGVVRTSPITALTVELSAEVYARLRAEAERQGNPPEGVVEEWVVERLVVPPRTYDRERSIAAMRAAGLLLEPTSEQLAWAETVDVTLEEVSDALDRAGGKPLSEIILEQRGPKG